MHNALDSDQPSVHERRHPSRDITRNMAELYAAYVLYLNRVPRSHFMYTTSSTNTQMRARRTGHTDWTVL